MAARPRTPSENGSTGYYSHSPYQQQQQHHNNSNTGHPQMGGGTGNNSFECGRQAASAHSTGNSYGNNNSTVTRSFGGNTNPHGNNSAGGYYSAPQHVGGHNSQQYNSFGSQNDFYTGEGPSYHHNNNSTSNGNPPDASSSCGDYYVGGNPGQGYGSQRTGSGRYPPTSFPHEGQTGSASNAGSYSGSPNGLLPIAVGHGANLRSSGPVLSRGGDVPPCAHGSFTGGGMSVSSTASSSHRSRKRRGVGRGGSCSSSPVAPVPVMGSGLDVGAGGSGGLLTVCTPEGTSQSGDSSASSIGDNLPLCPDDAGCALINDRAHQHKFAHTCRLFPCYHGHIRRHAKLFRHAVGQVAVTNAQGNKSKLMALASVNFAAISPDAPNATCVTVSNKDVAYDIHGDWSVVKVHTFKRYLHQVFAVEPKHQQLAMEERALSSASSFPGDASPMSGNAMRRVPMDDDLEHVQSYITRYPNAIIAMTDSSAGVGERERQKIRESIVSEL